MKERNLEAGQSHLYGIHLESGSALAVTIDQLGIDLLVRLRGPGGSEIVMVDTPGAIGSQGPEKLWAVADRTGTYRLEVEAPARVNPGRYRITMEPVRPASSRDRFLAAATAEFAAGEALALAGGRAESRLAVARYLEARRLWMKHQELPLAGVATFQLAAALHRSGEVDQAVIEYQRAIPLLESAGKWAEAARALDWCGSIQFSKVDFEASLKFYKRAAELWRQEEKAEEEAEAYAGVGRALATLGETGEALAAYDRALALARSVGDDSEAMILQNRGRAFLQAGDLEGAVADLTGALEVHGTGGSPRGLGAILNGLGSAFLDLGDPDKALLYARQALALDLPSLDRALSLNQQGLALLKLDQPEQALDSFNEARDLLPAADDRRLEARVSHNLGLALLQLSRGDEAREHLLEAREAFTEVGERVAATSALFSLARAERTLGHADAALQAIETSLAEVEALRLEPRGSATRSHHLARHQALFDFAIDLQMDRHRQDSTRGAAAEAFQWAEKSRARTLLDVVSQPRTEGLESADPEREISDQEVLELSLRQRINSLDRLYEDPDSGVSRQRLKQELRELVRRHDEVASGLRLGESRPRPEPASLTEIQASLEEATALLVYRLGPERSHLWLVSRAEVFTAELPRRDKLARLARRAHRWLRKSHHSEAAAATRVALEELSKALLGPIVGKLPTHRLAVIPDGELFYVPFGALPRPPRGPKGQLAKPLLADLEVVFLPSASLWVQARQAPPARGTRAGAVAVVADPVFHVSDSRLEVDLGARREPPPSSEEEAVRPWPRLENTRQEADSILALAPAADSLAALGFAANLELARSGSLSGYRVLHFATHAEIDPDLPARSRLVLSLLDRQGRSREGYLRAHEIAQLDLASELVVLSGCGTALGREIRGEGLVGLTQAFRLAGAAQTLVTLWPVEDRATAALMKRFYGHLLGAGEEPSEALRRAQLWLRSQPGWKAPYYWAGFVLQGH
ncbi:MAG: CHAT domain-containing protein [Deltaproteobacteria bacterium]|nr:CHAT domain-containing protein [Deltaproteobacteria bacterium]